MSADMAMEQVNGNGPEEPIDTPEVSRSEHFAALLEAGLPQNVAEKLDELYVAGLVAHSDLDERALEALKEFNEEGALQVLVQFKESDLSHVQNKSAFLCGVMKTYRQREKQGTKVSDSTKGPDEAKIKELLDRTDYTLDVTTGQRKYGGPPPEPVYSGAQPNVGTEIFIGKIPRDLFEDELVPLFEKAGPIWDLRLMMDPLSGLNRGYAFVTFCTKEAAQEAVKLCNNHEIRPNKHIGVCISVANNRLFVGSIPKSKTKEQIVEEFAKVTEGLSDVILYHQPDDKKKNRGFCFLEYEDHKTAIQPEESPPGVRWRAAQTRLSCSAPTGEEKPRPSMLRHLTSKIKATGPITVAEYMREALTNPVTGYYVRNDMLGPDGDFITSPEISQIFGELLGVWTLSEWMAAGRPKRLQLVELGPGKGSLAGDVLRVFSQLRSVVGGASVSLHLVEVSPVLSRLQAQNLTGSRNREADGEDQLVYRRGETAAGVPVSWYRRLEDVPSGTRDDTGFPLSASTHKRESTSVTLVMCWFWCPLWTKVVVLVLVPPVD
ncbi:heterogeneous nuclear ribonucleoprotein Q-like isoform X1 [Cyclopterus lumpus]|uniref:heterogeneous nuclear ribonucleoprotein Q-like isoform X1 n=1 Tax=Cyclopterus lumpus TaxID=8103 RepID=UPI0014865BBB|nr:heterogeneous nuclear ribonucleoprotein Q-like isoform X1 [Cyclopterus lumpus]